MVTQLMRVERMKVDRIMQDRQLAEWRRDSFREVTTRVMDFRRSFFDVVRRDNYMLSPANFRSFDVTVSNPTAASAIAGSEAQSGSVTINSITQLATGATVIGSNLSTSVSGTPVFSGAEGEQVIDLSGKSFTLQLDGVSRTIGFGSEATFANVEDLATGLNTLLDNAFGAGRVVATADGGSFTLTAENSTLQVGSGNALATLGLTTGSSNRMNINSALGRGDLAFTINGVDFSFTNSQTLRDIMSTVNNSNAGVTLSYSSITDKMTLTSTTTGAGQAIEIANTTGDFFGLGSFSGIDVGTVSNGQDALLRVNGIDIVRSQNTFTVDGVSLTLREESATPVVIDLARNHDKSFDMIVKFVNDYNELIQMVHGKMNEPVHRDFRPLTDEQRDALKEKDVEKWEEKAKSGLLRNDPLLERMLSSMRSALIAPVEGSGISLSSIGISSGSYRDRGRLTINEETLRQALATRGDEVINLFAKSSDTAYSPNLTAEQKNVRYGEIGLARRLSDIVEDNVRTIRDNAGRKGLLLEQAGIAGDASDSRNTIAEHIKRLNARINSTLDILDRREEDYWKRFTAMERAMGQLNSQSDWLSQQLASWNK
jgi:flagellar hook-associated protein 2